MKPIVVLLAAAAALAFAGTAHAGNLYFSAYKNGKLTSVFDSKTKKRVAGPNLRVYSQAEFDKSSARRKKQLSVTADMCGVKYYMTKAATRWRAAHDKASHVIQVRDLVGKRKFNVVCKGDAAAGKNEPPARGDNPPGGNNPPPGGNNPPPGGNNPPPADGKKN